MVGRFSGGGFEAGSRKLGYHFRDRLLSALMLDLFARDWKFDPSPSSAGSCANPTSSERGPASIDLRISPSAWRQASWLWLPYVGHLGCFPSGSKVPAGYAKRDVPAFGKTSRRVSIARAPVVQHLNILNDLRPRRVPAYRRIPKRATPDHSRP